MLKEINVDKFNKKNYVLQSSNIFFSKDQLIHFEKLIFHAQKNY